MMREKERLEKWERETIGRGKERQKQVWAIWMARIKQRGCDCGESRGEEREGEGIEAG